MTVLNSQIHVWGPQTPEDPWPEGGFDRLVAHTGGSRLKLPADEAVDPGVLLAIMDEAAVDAAILVPHSCEGDRNDAALAAARAHPARFGVMGRLPLESRQEALDVMAGWRSHPGAFGFRLTFAAGTDSERWLTDGSLEWFWPLAEDMGLPLMVNLSGRLSELADVALRFPRLALAVDHFGLNSNDRDAAALQRVRGLCELAEVPNLSVKASSAPSYTTEPYPFPTMRLCVRELVAAFGPERVFWGSDVTRIPVSLRQSLDFVRDDDVLARSERNLVLGDALAQWLGWNR